MFFIPAPVPYIDIVIFSVILGAVLQHKKKNEKMKKNPYTMLCDGFRLMYFFHRMQFNYSIVYLP